MGNDTKHVNTTLFSVEKKIEIDFFDRVKKVIFSSVKNDSDGKTNAVNIHNRVILIL